MPSKIFNELFPLSQQGGDVTFNDFTTDTSCRKPCARCLGEHIIPSDGPADINSGGLLFIGESPGPDETETDKPFTKKAGKDFNKTYLRLAGLSRETITFTNTLKCSIPGKRTPSVAHVQECTNMYLIHEILHQNPALIVTMGSVALRFVNDNSIRVNPAEPEFLNLEAHAGFVYRRKFEFGTYDVFPVYHPAIGLRDSSKIVYLIDNFTSLKHWLSGTYKGPTNLYPNVDYKEITTKQEYDTYLQDCLKRNAGPVYVALDSEGDDDGLYSIQISHFPGTALMIDGSNVELIKYVFNVFNSSNIAHFITHYEFHDLLEIFKAYRIDIDTDPQYSDLRLKLADTMCYSFHTQRTPKKLKALAWRLCGVNMTSFHDLVYPYSMAAVIPDMETILEHPVCESTPCYGKKGNLLKKVIPNPIASDIRRILRCTIKSRENQDPDAKPYQTWKKWAEFLGKLDGDAPLTKKAAIIKLKELLLSGELKFTKFSIRNLPREKAIYYGCCDADVTGRVFTAIKGMQLDFPVGDGQLKKHWIKTT